jgi:hypothetical protein
MTSETWKMVKWSALAVFLPVLLYLRVIGATIGTYFVLAVVMLAAVGVWKCADKRESEAKAEEMRSR